MSPGEMKLPELEQRFVRGTFIGPEFFLDPAFLGKLKAEILNEFVATELEYRAKAAALEAEKLHAMAGIVRRQK